MMTQQSRPEFAKRKSPKTLPADPNSAMQEMMGIIDSLRGIYVQETHALSTADTNTFLQLQPVKLETARQYQNGIEFMLQNKEEMRHAHPSLKARLSAMQSEFAELGRENMDALNRMQRTTQRLGDTIMNAARDEAKKQRAVNYAETGIMAASERKSVSMGISETA